VRSPQATALKNVRKAKDQVGIGNANHSALMSGKWNRMDMRVQQILNSVQHTIRPEFKKKTLSSALFRFFDNSGVMLSSEPRSSARNSLSDKARSWLSVDIRLFGEYQVVWTSIAGAKTSGSNQVRSELSGECSTVKAKDERPALQRQPQTSDRIQKV